MINDHGCDVDHINGIIDLTDKGMGVCRDLVVLLFCIKKLIVYFHKLGLKYW